jgi:hypothetical protein
MIIKKFYPFILLLLILGCKHTVVRNNAPEDIQESTEFVRNFYAIVARDQFDSASTFFSNSFGVEAGKSVLNQVKRANGELMEIEIVQVRTSYIEEVSNVRKDYGVEINTIYSNGKAVEQIHLINENDKLKIDGYHIKVAV